MVVTIESAAGVRSAAPTPWAARAATRAPGDGASPLASDAAVNSDRPARKTKRRSNRSASRPPSRNRIDQGCRAPVAELPSSAGGWVAVADIGDPHYYGLHSCQP